MVYKAHLTQQGPTMARTPRKRLSEKQTPKTQSEVLNGWKQIADFLGQPLAVAQRWGKTGMPISHEGRQVTASTEQLNRWIGRESAMTGPAHIASDDTDLSAELKRGLAEVRKHQRHEN
jgi:phage terminase Nu1 subunit (DNA packaging protein)